MLLEKVCATLDEQLSLAEDDRGVEWLADLSYYFYSLYSRDVRAYRGEKSRHVELDFLKSVSARLLFNALARTLLLEPQTFHLTVRTGINIEPGLAVRLSALDEAFERSQGPFALWLVGGVLPADQLGLLFQLFAREQSRAFSTFLFFAVHFMDARGAGFSKQLEAVARGDAEDAIQWLTHQVAAFAAELHGHTFDLLFRRTCESCGYTHQISAELNDQRHYINSLRGLSEFEYFRTVFRDRSLGIQDIECAIKEQNDVQEQLLQLYGPQISEQLSQVQQHIVGGSAREQLSSSLDGLRRFFEVMVNLLPMNYFSQQDATGYTPSHKDYVGKIKNLLQLFQTSKSKKKLISSASDC